MTDSGVIVHGNSALIKHSGGDRVPSRLKRIRNSVAPTGDISFASIYSAHGQGSDDSLNSSNAEMSSLFSFDFFVGISHLFLFAFCGMFGRILGNINN